MAGPLRHRQPTSTPFERAKLLIRAQPPDPGTCPTQATCLQSPRPRLFQDLSTVRDCAGDDSRSGYCLDAVSAIHACSGVRDSMKCSLKHVDDLLRSQPLKLIDEVCSEVAVEWAGSPRSHARLLPSLYRTKAAFTFGVAQGLAVGRWTVEWFCRGTRCVTVRQARAPRVRPGRGRYRRSTAQGPARSGRGRRAGRVRKAVPAALLPGAAPAAPTPWSPDAVCR